MAGDHDFGDRDKAVLDQRRVSVGISVGSGAWIGAGARVLDGVTIGDRAVIGAQRRGPCRCARWRHRRRDPRAHPRAEARAEGRGDRRGRSRLSGVAVIAIVTSAPPLIEGGHLVLARALERALLEAGHRAGIVTTPSNRFGRQGPAYLANWLTDVGMTGTGDRVDQVISMRFPSYAVRHPNHTCWLEHTMREYYDQWDRFSSGLSPQGRVKETVRRTLVRAADSYLLQAPRLAPLRHFAGGGRPAQDMEPRGRSGAASAASATLVPM